MANKISAFEDLPFFALKAGIETYFCHRHTVVKDDLHLKVTDPRKWDEQLRQTMEQEITFKKELQTAEGANSRHAVALNTADAIGMRALPLDLLAKYCVSAVLASMRIEAEQHRKQIADECRAIAGSFPNIMLELTRPEQSTFRSLTGSNSLWSKIGLSER